MPINSVLVINPQTGLMTRLVNIVSAVVAMCIVAAPANAESVMGGGRDARDAAMELQPYLQCVPYAREVSGISIYGDAHTWWDQAAGRYARGREPRVGAVMALRPHRNMQLGHVAAVSRVVDERTILLRHANWSPIDGRRGQIEDDVMAVDVSPGNDWSEVRIWYAPIDGLGTTHWPVEGFIYGTDLQKPEAARTRVVSRGNPIAAIIAAKMD